jgi:uroporphyrinogen-III synthase
LAQAGFNGLRILSLESRRSKEIATLIENQGGEAFVVPAMREIPLESNQQALDFARDLLARRFDLIIFLTGVGARALLEIAQTRYGREEFLDALRSVKIASRGPKPSSVLREWKVPITVVAADPSTWRELIVAIDAEFGESLRGFHVAVQEYGASNAELLSALSERTENVTNVPVYRWALPEDTEPLKKCVVSLVNGKFDIALFMTAVQVIHLFLIAEQIGLADQLRTALQFMVVLSIGPSTSEELRRHGIYPDFEPSKPKMGFLISEAAQHAARLIDQKRAQSSKHVQVK